MIARDLATLASVFSTSEEITLGPTDQAAVKAALLHSAAVLGGAPEADVERLAAALRQRAAGYGRPEPGAAYRVSA